jgi:hypothetical protein
MLNKPSVKEAASSRLGAEYFSIIYPCPIPFTATLKKNRNKFQKSNSRTAKIQKILIPKKPQKIKI